MKKITELKLRKIAEKTIGLLAKLSITQTIDVFSIILSCLTPDILHAIFIRVSCLLYENGFEFDTDTTQVPEAYAPHDPKEQEQLDKTFKKIMQLKDKKPQEKN